MAFDGITIANITKELNDTLIGGRLNKIAQPEADELLLTIKSNSGQFRLVLSANASLPLLYLTDKNKQSPLTAPNFCMLLRKHIQNGRIVSITQPGLERIVNIEIEHLDEMGDLCRKRLIIELMGKHSNIIFCQENGMIIDSIKHISGLVSSVREVLPGREYFIPQTQEKEDAFAATEDTFIEKISAKPMPLFKAIYTTYTGFSPIMAQQICYLAGLDGETSTAAFSKEDFAKLYKIFSDMINDIREGNFCPSIIYASKSPIEYAALPLTLYTDSTHTAVEYPNMSSLLEAYYAQKSTQTRIRQKSTDLRKIVQTALERNVKKYDLQLSQMRDTEKKDKYRIYGELLNTYGYNIEPGAKSFEALNYYTNENVIIPLDNTLTPAQNAKKYFDKYQKLKRTYEALSQLTIEVKAEIDQLESIATALDIATKEEDLIEIKEELIQSGYIRRKGSAKQQRKASKPLHYMNSDGYHFYVGKNNLQNDALTFKFATGGDWWFHAKDMPGSHVILKNDGNGELPDNVYEDAARLAAYYSKGRGQEKVEIDYIQKKHVKKPAGAKPGFVVYYTNYSMMIDADISSLTLIEE